MAREFTESAKFVIKTPDGARMDLNGKGSVVNLMVMAFSLLPEERRERMLNKLQAKHDDMLKQKAEQATGAAA